MKSTEKDHGGCCGGSSAADDNAHCAMDAEAKKTGKDGCGCNAAPAGSAGETEKKAGCCG